MKNEIKFFNGIMHGVEVTEEFKDLLNGKAARAAIATADAATLSQRKSKGFYSRSNLKSGNIKSGDSDRSPLFCTVMAEK